MPGLIAPSSSAASVGATVGMKRPLDQDNAPAHGEPRPKLRKVTRKLRHTQPIQHIADPVSAEIDPTGQHKDFFDQQLHRAIAIGCKGAGFDGARPEAVEMFRGAVDNYMRTFLGRVRQSMSASRRTDMVANDWIYALKSTGIVGSSALEPHLETGEVPPSLLQPPIAPAEPAEASPPDLEGLLGPDLSGKAEKESRKWIPSHFPAFPSQHTWRATPVFTQRENDPRRIREKATEEGILAETSLRKLMEAQKAGMQANKARKQRRSKRMKESDKLWQEAMVDVLQDEEERERKKQQQERFEDGMDFSDDEDATQIPLPPPKASADVKKSLQEGVRVNYDRKFWRKSARGF